MTDEERMEMISKLLAKIVSERIGPERDGEIVPFSLKITGFISRGVTTASSSSEFKIEVG